MAGLDGKAIVITGSGRGIGAATARAAALEGAKVVINDIIAENAEAVAAEIRAAGGQAVAQPGDVSRPETAEALVQRCIAEFGVITGLVNNAAILRPGRLHELTLKDLRDSLDANVVGVFNCAKAAVGPMLAQGAGSIVNITSGAHTGQDDLSIYGATKGAVASFTYVWAGEYAGTGVRVNAISPMAMGAMNQNMAALQKSRGIATPPATFNMPPPEANPPAILFLLSDRARNVSGQIVRIVGRQLSLMNHPAIRAPSLENDHWTLESVAQAFETTLAVNQLPTDVAIYDIAAVRGGKVAAA
jgi:NAD(P)-dependent dehydrogenase (short-subunit alcohol dehydrogenase family)